MRASQWGLCEVKKKDSQQTNFAEKRIKSWWKHADLSSCVLSPPKGLKLQQIYKNLLHDTVPKNVYQLKTGNLFCSELQTRHCCELIEVIGEPRSKI